MIVQLERLHDTMEFSFDINDREYDIPKDIGTVQTPIHVEGQLQRIADEITLSGRITTRIEMVCSRCLKPYGEDIDGRFEVIYRPRPDELITADEIELDERELNVSYYDNHLLNISNALRDQVLLLLPLKPLCDPECKGLCSSCGQDLNVATCSCVTDKIDPRLAILEQLLK